MTTSEPIDIRFREGVRLFEEGKFFEAHEAWEAHWLVEQDETRKLLLQAFIQVAAALHKVVVSNAPAPAASLFAKALAKLERCPAALGGLDVEAFRERVRACATELAAGRYDARAATGATRLTVPTLATTVAAVPGALTAPERGPARR